MTLIAEDLLLLLLDDETGKPQTQQLQIALGGAVLVELALEGMVEVVDAKSVWRKARVWPVEGARPGDPVLTAAWATVGEKERTAQALVERLGKGLDDTLCGRLVECGILERRDAKVLGLFPRTRWPARDSSHEDAVRRALTTVLVNDNEPAPRIGALVALLHAVDRAHKSVRHAGVSDRDVKKRAKQLAEGQWAATAVMEAVAAATAGTVAAMTAATSASSGRGLAEVLDQWLRSRPRRVTVISPAATRTSRALGNEVACQPRSCAALRVTSSGTSRSWESSPETGGPATLRIGITPPHTPAPTSSGSSTGPSARAFMDASASGTASTEAAASSLRVLARRVAERPGIMWSTVSASACSFSSASTTTRARPMTTADR